MLRSANRNAAQTRERLLASAMDEFAANGLAGARIDRIANAAGVSKPMLYNYFGDKEALFDAALTQEILAAADVEPFDAGDLAGYAGRTYDILVECPRLWRLLTWYHLERGLDVLMLPAGHEVLKAKQSSVHAAQKDGRITDAFGPMEIVRLVSLLAQLWTTAEPAETEAEHNRRRSVIIRAVTRLMQV